MNATTNKDESESPYYNYSSSPSSTSSQTNSPPSSSQSSWHAQNTKQVSSSHKRKAGRKKFKETRHPIYRGVRQKNGNKWVCEVREPNTKSRIWLGTYPTPEMAARAHDVAVLALKGTSAIFNFPDTVSLLPIANSSSALDIRAAASKVSKVFGPTISTTPSCSSSSTTRVHTNNHFLVDDIFKGSVNNDDESKSLFFDEEALYNMPGLLDSMAEGLLITPPSMSSAFDWDQLDSEMDLTLWED